MKWHDASEKPNCENVLVKWGYYPGYAVLEWDGECLCETDHDCREWAYDLKEIEKWIDVKEIEND